MYLITSNNTKLRISNIENREWPSRRATATLHHPRDPDQEIVIEPLEWVDFATFTGTVDVKWYRPHCPNAIKGTVQI